MNKADLIESLAASHFDGNKAAAARTLNIVVDAITANLAETGKVSISGFGVFETVQRDARTVRNPRTGEKKAVEGFKFPRFRPGTALKEAVEASTVEAHVHAKSSQN